VCTLAHVFEGLGFATIALASIREQAENVGPPRALHGNFPLGRPLGRPNDPSLQNRVLAAAFALLDRPRGPVLETFPESVSDVAEEALVCHLPPRLDPNVLPAVDEANALRAAYRRSVEARDGRTNFGRVLTEAQIPTVLAALDRIVSGTDWKQAGLPADPAQIAIDLRTYYCEAALALAEDPTRATATAWALERWFLQDTETGRLMMAARQAMKDAGASFAAWFYMAPLDR
jgi:hypothetical protein